MVSKSNAMNYNPLAMEDQSFHSLERSLHMEAGLDGGLGLLSFHFAMYSAILVWLMICIFKIFWLYWSLNSGFCTC
jgi:hypothetical protein